MRKLADPGQVVKNISDMSGSIGDPTTSYPVWINTYAGAVNSVLPGTLPLIDLTNSTGAAGTAGNFEWNQFNSAFADRIHQSYFVHEQISNYTLNFVL